jgi:HD superfamily phosphodiesterase
MGNSIEHFVEKLERLEGMMKTESGRGMARVRTERLRVFRGWWEEEMEGATGGV